MLELRSCCEHCNTHLPAESKNARICSFECTFCTQCVENVLDSICPNCGGDFQPRPIRPTTNLKNNICLAAFPAASQSLHRPVDLASHKALVAKVRLLHP
ncbi:MAG: hypothetical protein ACI9ES_002244 [Oceanospirillaceae bacterium]|jgi:hypothetical protein